jgi:hypothetical protein
VDNEGGAVRIQVGQRNSDGLIAFDEYSTLRAIHQASNNRLDGFVSNAIREGQYNTYYRDFRRHSRFDSLRPFI